MTTQAIKMLITLSGVPIPRFPGGMQGSMREARAAPAGHSQFQPEPTTHHRVQLGKVFDKGQKHDTDKIRKEKSDSSADTKKRVLEQRSSCRLWKGPWWSSGRQGGAHGESTQEQACPEGLRLMGRTCTGAGEQCEEENREKLLKTTLSCSPFPIPWRREVEPGRRQGGERGLLVCFLGVFSQYPNLF